MYKLASHKFGNRISPLPGNKNSWAGNMDATSTKSTSMISTSSYLGREACHICQRTSEGTITIHACKFCGRIVCGDHSKHRRDLSSQVPNARICDKCYSNTVCAGVSDHLKAELQTLKRQLEDQRTTMERRVSDLAGKEELATTMRGRLEEVQRTAEIRRKEGEAKVMAARAQAQACSSTVKRLRNAVDVSRSGIRKLKETICEKKAQQDAVNREASLLLTDMPQFEEAHRRVRDRLTQYWSKSMVLREFCSNCQGRFRLKQASSTLSRTRASRPHGNKVCAQCSLS